MFKWGKRSKSVVKEPKEKPQTRQRSFSLPVICNIDLEPSGQRDTLKQFRTYVKEGVGVDTPRVTVTKAKTPSGRRNSFTYIVDNDSIMTFYPPE